ncbi:hypothetical protein KHA96_07915 [Bacillus sp. FJAT-49711]|uniref:YczE/YyaS/YitT family protein n=1 Tax=Bacillus sp. FJAT-49711 TaxID=2833585 RepID=UPI001BC98932|nr:hypothetical protein [Bacillus sp. FJAT-49711]MBS4218236.1 hypothetical protein [Bacillus sp. FJAT-49711]
MKLLKRIFLLSILMIIIGIGASLTLKAAIGVMGFDALTQSISFLSGIKVGTVGMILNCSFVLGQWILLRKDFNFRHLLQVPMSILIGIVINFIFYDVLGSFIFDHYIVKLILLLVALIILAFAIGAVMALDVVTFALEGFCMALAKKTKWNFVLVRQGIDIVCILLVILLTFGFSLQLTIREGTIIGMLTLAPLMGYFMKRIQPVFRKLGLTNEEVEKIDANKNSVKAV